MPTDDAFFFFNRIRLERVGVVGPDLDCCWAGLQALDRRAGDRTATGLICRFWMRHRWFAGSGCDTSGLRSLVVIPPVSGPWMRHFSAKTRKKGRAGGGFARSRSDA